LRWYRHDGWTDGTARWTAGQGGNLLSGGWNIYRTVFSGGQGVIYAITPDGQLRWYRHDGWTDGTARWTAGQGGNLLSGGWNIYRTVFSETAHSAIRPQPMLSDNVISYRTDCFGLGGELQGQEGEVSAASNEPILISGPKLPGERLSWNYRAVDEAGALRYRNGVLKAGLNGRVQLAILNFNGSFDGDKLEAKLHAEAVTGRLDGSANFDLPGSSGVLDGYAQGPAIYTDLEASPDGVGGKLGASAGEIGGRVAVNVFGQPYGTGVPVGLKAELGVHWGSTSTLKLPLITISGPNPMAGVATFAENAILDVVRDPQRTSEQAMKDIIGAGVDGAGTIGHAAEGAIGLIGSIPDLFEVDDDEPNIVTSDHPEGRRPPLAPGAVYFD
ncbi:tachylectin-related carbohydrate-binding protein, partial [Streptomyces sp. NPDC020598]